MKPAVPLSRYLTFTALAVGVCAADLASKSWVFRWLGGPSGGIWWAWEGVFGFQTSLNRGALFGLGQGFWLVFAAMSVVAAAGIVVWLFAFRAANDWLRTIALGLVTGGILGNLYDRLALHRLTWVDGTPAHAVRDFIVMFQVGEWHWPNYNLADAGLVCGAGLLICQAFLAKPTPSEAD
ncbi:MAG: signal peptidase II [Thermoguttaceae bacterium]